MSEWRIETNIPPETRAERRERIAVAIMAGLVSCPDVRATEPVIAEHAIKLAQELMAQLDEAARRDAKGESK